MHEGDFAVALRVALVASTEAEEVAAESQLTELGIAPKNGWTADYPVTPDILVELQAAVGAAVDSGNPAISREEARERSCP